MELQKVSIFNYKSIKEAVDVPFASGGGLITFIGKNGSGKTNILQAIRKTMVKQTGFNRVEKEQISGQYILKVTKEEQEKYFSSIDVARCGDEITVGFTNGEDHVKKVQAPILTVSVGKYKVKLNDLLGRIKKAGKNYVDKLKEIEHSYDSPYYLSIKAVNEKRGEYLFLDSYRIANIKENIERQVNDIKSYLEKSFEKDYITIGDYYNYSSLHTSWPIEFYQIASDKEIYISSIIAKSLG